MRGASGRSARDIPQLVELHAGYPEGSLRFPDPRSAEGTDGALDIGALGACKGLGTVWGGFLSAVSVCWLSCCVWGLWCRLWRRHTA